MVKDTASAFKSQLNVLLSFLREIEVDKIEAASGEVVGQVEGVSTERACYWNENGEALLKIKGEKDVKVSKQEEKIRLE